MAVGLPLQSAEGLAEAPRKHYPVEADRSVGLWDEVVKAQGTVALPQCFVFAAVGLDPLVPIRAHFLSGDQGKGLSGAR